jgi:hypothetical protein
MCAAAVAWSRISSSQPRPRCRGVFEILDILGVEHGAGGSMAGAAAALQQLPARAAGSPAAHAGGAATGRSPRARRPAALQDGQREADRAGALVVLESLGAVELLAT